MIEECVKHQEFRAISIDGTFRVCLSVLGQKPFNMKKSDREDAPFHGHESVSRVITVRGRTGAVVSICFLPLAKVLKTFKQVYRRA